MEMLCHPISKCTHRTAEYTTHLPSAELLPLALSEAPPFLLVVPPFLLVVPPFLLVVPVFLLVVPVFLLFVPVFLLAALAASMAPAELVEGVAPEAAAGKEGRYIKNVFCCNGLL